MPTANRPSGSWSGTQEKYLQKLICNKIVNYRNRNPDCLFLITEEHFPDYISPGAKGRNTAIQRMLGEFLQYEQDLELRDRTDFRIAMGYSKPFWSYKFKKSGPWYEVGLCILTGDICWWSGPFAPGKWNDLFIFWDSLQLMLEPGERCETDMGYQV